MTWQIARKGDQYRIWSTVSDAWITDWVSRNVALAVWYDDALMTFKKKVIERYLSFPNYWGDKDSKDYRAIHMDKERHEQLLQWLRQLSDTLELEDYERLVDETYEKVVNELDVDAHS